MKQVVSVSLGSADNTYEFDTDFLGEKFNVKHFGTNGNLDKVSALLKEWDGKADIIGLGSIKYSNVIGAEVLDPISEKFLQMAKTLNTPTTTGATLRMTAFEWAFRHLQFKHKNYFDHTTQLFTNGLVQYKFAKIMNEFTDNLSFADPIFQHKIPKFINSMKDLELYAKGIHPILDYVPKGILPLNILNEYLLKQKMKKVNIILVPYKDFYEHLEGTTSEELSGKTVITSTVYEDREKFLAERGVEVIIDCTPKPLDRLVSINVLEAMMLASLGVDKFTPDDALELICKLELEPRVIYPKGEVKRVNRFAFVIHPLSQEMLKSDKIIDNIAKVTPKGVMDVIEKGVAYSPPWIYSKVTGIKSPTGVEAEGWLITVGGTPKQMLAHSAEFTYKRLLKAAEMARKMGAQIIGLGAFTKVVGDAGVTVSKLSHIPVTTGNSYSASGALWAAGDAVRRMGLIDPPESGKRIRGKSMVVGATGAIGSACCRLLAQVFEELYMVDIRNAKLLALRESINEETPGCNITVSTRADKYVGDMDVIVTATSSAGKKILDIMQVKPGCVITDVARPLDLSAEDVAKRPDVLVIESGEIELPGDPKYKDIGLPPKVVYACMAETIVLALEGRFEVFTIGRDIEWEKVKEIYKMGLKHGMKLAAISGVNGVYSDEDIMRVKELALEARKTWKQPSAD